MDIEKNCGRDTGCLVRSVELSAGVTSGAFAFLAVSQFDELITTVNQAVNIDLPTRESSVIAGLFVMAVVVAFAEYANQKGWLI